MRILERLKTVLAIPFIATTLLAGVVTASAEEKVTIQIDGAAVPYYLPLYVAQKEGYFKEQGLDVSAVREALGRLAEWNERQAQVVTLRYFGGMTVSEVAVALQVAPVTVERDWRLARAWLRDQL